ncbi:MAG: hypothetical protein OTJ97_03160, partial [SAR202 cluster bacterium]|nr:hypothetical protein [SAR202 cluster bacterium]
MHLVRTTLADLCSSQDGSQVGPSLAVPDLIGVRWTMRPSRIGALLAVLATASRGKDNANAASRGKDNPVLATANAGPVGPGAGLSPLADLSRPPRVVAATTTAPSGGALRRIGRSGSVA